jgi:hypothetical protein
VPSTFGIGYSASSVLEIGLNRPAGTTLLLNCARPFPVDMSPVIGS